MPTVVYYDLLNQPDSGFPWRTVLIILFALALGVLLYAYTVISEDPTYKNQKLRIIRSCAGDSGIHAGEAERIRCKPDVSFPHSFLCVFC
ncbi:MAG: hypothetical protein IV090_24030 [Candidatus Sericytochromatia bacterium]|nr:hypothetical protein [Candidatus Sericytochromatia bacterium]